MSVTVLRQNRLNHIRARQIVREHLIHDLRDGGKNRPPVRPFLIVGRGTRHCEVKSFSPVPLGENPIQGKRLDGEDIRPERRVRPGRIDHAGGHIINIILIAHIVILRRGIRRRTVVHHNVLRYHNPA